MFNPDVKRGESAAPNGFGGGPTVTLVGGGAPTLEFVNGEKLREVPATLAEYANELVDMILEDATVASPGRDRIGVDRPKSWCLVADSSFSSEP